MFDYQNELASFLNIETTTICSEEENQMLHSLIESGQPLPPGYRKSTENSTLFVKAIEIPATAELEQKLKLQNSKNLRTIKNCLIFFTVLAALQLAFGFILALTSLSN